MTVSRVPKFLTGALATAGARHAGVALLIATALALGACASDVPDTPALAERAYLTIVKRGCVAGRKLVDEAARGRPTTAVYLQRIRDGIQTGQRDFARLLAPPRLRRVHRELLRLNEARLAMIESALRILESGTGPQSAAEIVARDRELVRRGNAIAGRLGLDECVNDL